VASFGLGISIFATNVEILYVTLGLVTGFGFGLMYLPAIVSVSCYFETKRSFATGIAVCGSGVGTFLFAPLCEFLINTYHWTGALLILTAICANCILFGSLFRPIEAPSAKTFVDLDSDLTNDEREKLMIIKEEATNSSSSEHQIRTVAAVSHHQDDLHDDQDEEEERMNGMPIPMPIPKSLIVCSSSARMARSQPHLLQVPGSPCDSRKFGSYGNLQPDADYHVKNRRLSIASSVGSGVMLRKDILYTGSLLNIDEYRANPKVFSTAAVPDDEETAQAEGGSMIDLSLFKDPIFMLFALSNFCTSIGFNVPYVFMKDKALDLDIESQDASFLIAVIGIANTIGRIILGYISDKPWLNRLYLYNSALAISGIATALSSFCVTYTSLVVYAAVFGATIGAYVGLTSVVLVDLLGLQKLTNAFGLVLMFQGIASLAGPPIAGRLKDTTNSYDPAFYVAGVMIAISGLMLFAIPLLQRCSGKSKVHDSTKEVAHLENGD